LLGMTLAWRPWRQRRKALAGDLSRSKAGTSSAATRSALPS